MGTRASLSARTLPADPSSSSQAATKNYVDTKAIPYSYAAFDIGFSDSMRFGDLFSSILRTQAIAAGSSSTRFIRYGMKLPDSNVTGTVTGIRFWINAAVSGTATVSFYYGSTQSAITKQGSNVTVSTNAIGYKTVAASAPFTYTGSGATPTFVAVEINFSVAVTPVGASISAATSPIWSGGDGAYWQCSTSVGTNPSTVDLTGVGSATFIPWVAFY